MNELTAVVLRDRSLNRWELCSSLCNTIYRSCKFPDCMERVCMHDCVRACVCVCVFVCVGVYVRMYIQACVCTWVRAYVKCIHCNIYAETFLLSTERCQGI